MDTDPQARSHSTILFSFVVLLTQAMGASNLHAQQNPLELHCADAERFITEDAGMVAIIEPDTIQDWRTQQNVPGCRITAAGITPEDEATEAPLFYERLMAAGWTRTPDPRDAPNEASLRFRMRGSDCLFNFYPRGLLGTEADLEVSSSMPPGPHETAYNILVLCKPAMDAAPRP